MTFPPGSRTFSIASLLKTRSRRRFALSIAASASIAALAIVACGPPPIGWTGAGRMDTLPAPNPGTDSGTATETDAGDGVDSSDGGIVIDDDSGQDSGDGFDAGTDAGTEAGEDAGVDAGQGAGPDAGHPVDGSHAG